MALTQTQDYEAIRTSYGGSDLTAPSFLRSSYVKYNSIAKSKDLGAVESLIADITGTVGSQAGTNTLFFKFQLLNPADIRIQTRSTGEITDRYLSLGLLDGDRRPVQVDADGFGFINDVHNTAADESILKLPVGTYYATLSSLQWQSIPYAIRISVIKYILLDGVATGTCEPSARLPLQKIDGAAIGTNQSSATLKTPAQIKRTVGIAGATAQPVLTLVIPSGAAVGSMLPEGRLMMNWRLEGVAQGSNSSQGTLTSEAPYGYGY
jgi:hypothetical protein